ncbi:MAG: hypothetical protein JNL70_14535 [Saprospiraceae bacterium]|nr:hypothetical protein [Saprospiraceae bacterium]
MIMIVLRIKILLLCLLFFLQNIDCQNATTTDAGVLSGNLQANGNFYMRDSAIGAANIPQYDRQLVGADSWLTLNYNRAGFDIGVRFDLFNNSQLLNPRESYSANGIGRFYLKKRIHDLTIYGGYIYDQIGSGIIYRSYEDRPLGVDNALVGLNLDYQLTDNIHVKAFSGRQKQQFSFYKSTINGFNTEGFFTVKNVSLAPGLGLVHRTLDDETVNQVVSALATYTKADSIGAKYNTFAATFYNTLSVGKWTWYIETAFKTAEALFDPYAPKVNRDGTKTEGKFVNRSGTVLYTNIGYITEGVGITLEAKRTEGFTFRTTPFAVLNRGMLNFLPPMSRQNSYRLTTRYVPATQELGEQAVQLDIKLAPKDHLNLDLNVSNITTLDNVLLYREMYASCLFKKEKTDLTIGLQLQTYNQRIYEVKPNVPNVQTLTPFMAFQKRLDDKKSLKLEAQYMHTQQDYGSWLYGSAELSIAPRWSFTVLDMWNVVPKKTTKALHYPSVSIAFSHESNRITVAYVKQVEGVVCTGGICRLEPAFSGVKVGVSSVF